MPTRRLLVAATVATAVTLAVAATLPSARAGHAQMAAVAAPALAEPTITWSPERPRQGAVVRIEVVPAAGAEVAAVTGRFGEAAVRLERLDDGRYLGVAGVPVEASGTLALALTLHAAGGDSLVARRDVPVAAGDFRHERLTVAPRFGQPADSALAARIARENARARAVAERSVSTPRLWGGAWQRPRDSRITSGFGNGREFNGTVQSRHMGTDFAGAVGTPVRAANCGVVALVADFYLAGTAVYVDHGSGLVSGYFHLSRADVAEGDTIRTGQPLGRVGRSGRVTGPHLHWILRSNGVTVNPLTVFALDSAGVVGRCDRA